MPPKTSFAITIENIVAMATCHSGIFGGIISGISIPVTKKPSFIGCLLIVENTTSTRPPATYDTSTTGSTCFDPTKILSIKLPSAPVAK